MSDERRAMSGERTHNSQLKAHGFVIYSVILAFNLSIWPILVYNCLRGTILVIEAYRKRLHTSTTPTAVGGQYARTR